MRKSLLIVSVLPLLLLLPPAAAQDITPTFRSLRTYFQCTDQVVKLDNLHATQGTRATWSTTPPSGAFAGDGDGCGSVELTLRDNQGVAFDTHWEGTFTGNLRNLTVTLHDMSHRADTPLGAEFALITSLWVDGVAIVQDADVRPTASPGNSGATHEFSFSMINLPFGVEDGDGEIERDIVLQLRSRDANFFVWGASEVPSGIHFNPVSLQSPQVSG